MASTPEQETLQLRALKLQASIKGPFPSLPSLYGRGRDVMLAGYVMLARYSSRMQRLTRFLLLRQAMEVNGSS